MGMDVQIFQLLVFLVLIKTSYEETPFELNPRVLIAKEGTCTEIKCQVKGFNVDDNGAYWFWMKDGHWNDALKDFTATIIYSTNSSIRPVSPDFVDRVKFNGSLSFKRNRGNYAPIPQCSILICGLKKSDSGVYAFRFVGKTKQNTWVTKENVTLKVEDNPCLLKFQKPPPVMASQNILLTCSTLSSCSSNPQIQDFKQSPLTQLESRQDGSKITTVSFTARLEDDGKVFLCQTQDNLDKYFIQSISLSVEYAPKEIIAESSGTVEEGESVSLTCSVKGNPQPNVSWFKGGTRQFTQAKWEIISITDSQSGEYYCEAENKHGKVKSQPIFITVTYKPQIVIMKISPMFDVKEGDEMILMCDVKRSNPQPHKFAWFRDSEKLGQQERYVVQSIKPEASGSYTCTATNSVGTGTSQPFIITVQYRPRKTNIINSISHKVEVGSSLTLTCNTEAEPSPHGYSWYRYNSSKQNDFKFNTKIIDLTNIQRSDKACYKCSAINLIGKGDDSEPMCIEVLYPPTEPTLFMVTEVTEGQPITINCNVESNPLSTLTLIRTSALMTRPLVIPWDIYSPPNNHLYLTLNATSAHAGSYTCSATNSQGSKESKQRNVVVKYIPQKMTIQAQPDLTVEENASLTLHCSFQSYPSENYVKWMKMADGKNKFIVKAKSFTIKSVSPSDSGLYSCEATNAIGTGRSKFVEVKVIHAPKHTTIEVTAEKQERDGRRSVMLSCSSHSYPPVDQYLWYKRQATGKDILLSRNQKYKVYSNEAGVYYCVAKNEINEKSSDPMHLFERNIIMILKVVFLCLGSLLIIFLILLVYRYRRKRSIQQGTMNTQPLFGFSGWWNGTRRGNLNETFLVQPFRSRDDLLPDQQCRPKPQRCQPCPDSTPTSNNNIVYSTVNLPSGNQAPAARKPTKQEGGPTQEDSLNYASLHFWNQPKDKQVNAEEDMYAKVSKPKPKNEQGRLEDYENVNVPHAPKSPHPESDDSDTSEDEVELNYSQVSFTPKLGHQRDSTDSSTSDEDEIQYSDVKI